MATAQSMEARPPDALRLSGEAAMDKADGSGTILFELKARGWSKTVLDKLDIPADWLPPTFEGPEVTGKVTAEVLV